MIRIGLWAARYYSLKMIPLSGLMMTAGTFMIESSWMKLKNVPLGLRPEGFYGQLQMQMIFEEFSITKEEGKRFVKKKSKSGRRQAAAGG